MKRFILIGFLLAVLPLGAFAFDDLEAAIDIPTKYIAPQIYSRKAFAVTMKAENFSPLNGLVSNDMNPSTGTAFELCIKASDTLDHVIKFGTTARRLVTDAGVNAAYDAIRVGWGVKVYALEWGDFSDIHGLFNIYGIFGIEGYSATQTEDIGGGSPPTSFSGLGVSGGGGIEFIFTPVTSAFVEAVVQKTSLTQGAFELPFEGYLLSAGVKIEIL
ncbi:hypothetical protein ACFLZ2_01370 [Candidatus Margulisiibacteriota bacterium]